jgi:hypothetical protein
MSLFEDFPKNKWGVGIFVLAFISVITNAIVMSKLDKAGKVNSDEYRAATASLLMTLMIGCIAFICMNSHLSE